MSTKLHRRLDALAPNEIMRERRMWNKIGQCAEMVLILTFFFLAACALVFALFITWYIEVEIPRRRFIETLQLIRTHLLA
jgi:hypothetical protein